MKDFKRIGVLVVALSFVFQISNAQFKRIGIKTGVNISTARITSSDFLTAFESIGVELPSKFGNSTGASIGFLSQTSSNDIFVTDFGLFYSLQGFKEQELSLQMHYLKVPLVFKIRIPIAGPVALQGGFGPYASYAFLATETVDGKADEDILSVRKKNDDGFISTGDLKDYSPIDAGMIFGGDVEIKLPNESILLVGLNYELGIAKISNEIDLIGDPTGTIPSVFMNPSYKNNNINITVSYLFDVTGS